MSKHQIQRMLADLGVRPRHRFGQNFMIDGNLLRLVAEAGAIEHGELVIEVGPGTGSLTELLLGRGAQVLAVEIDRDLAGLLRGRFGESGQFSLIEGDALSGKHALNPELAARIAASRSQERAVKLVANLPYNIASPLLIDMLAAGTSLAAVTVQREVADRLRAGPGTDAYGPLSVMVQLLAKVEVLRTIPPQAFWPAPKVESALVRLVSDDRTGGQVRELGEFVHRLMSARRKTLRRALVQAGLDAERLLMALSLDGQLRPERLSPHQFLGLFRTATAASPAA